MGKRLDAVALRITRTVGTMWAAIGFGCLTLISLPAAISTHDPVIIVQWVAATFLQLVLLPIIMVGQNLTGASTEALIKETHDAVLEELTAVREIAAAIHQEVKE